MGSGGRDWVDVVVVLVVEGIQPRRRLWKKHRVMDVRVQATNDVRIGPR